MKKIIELPHSAYDYNCMISGLEDMLEARTGIRLPPYLAFFGSFIGFSSEVRAGSEAPRRVLPGWGIGKGLYQFLADVFGFRWRTVEGRSFEESWAAMRESIDRGVPLILGELDMYYLPYYEKFYRRIHVPIHYVTLVGYDAAGRTAFVLDNGLAEAQSIPVAGLQRALNIPAGGDSLPNTFHSFDLAPVPDGLEQHAVIRSILRKRGVLFLNPPAETQGVHSMRSLAREFPDWPRRLSRKGWHASLRSMVAFTCSTVPMPPQRLVPFPLDPHMLPHQGMRDRFAGLLDDLAREEGWPACREAAAAFRESGLLFQAMTDRITDFLAALFKTAAAAQPLDGVPPILERIAEIETQAFGLLAGLEDGDRRVEGAKIK